MFDRSKKKTNRLYVKKIVFFSNVNNVFNYAHKSSILVKSSFSLNVFLYMDISIAEKLLALGS